MLIRKIQKNISGSLKDCIKQHGEITKQNMNSACKRIVRNLLNIFIACKNNKER